MNRFGWMLVKDRFWESYETNRLIEEFQKQDIDIQLVDPNTIDIFVNKENKKSIVVNGLETDLPNRRIDILYTKPSEYPFAILYFTGSKEFNQKMRQHANEKGYSLNERNLTRNSPSGPPVSEDEYMRVISKPKPETEDDIFKFLDFRYLAPKDR